MFKRFTQRAKLINAFKVGDISHEIHIRNTTHKRFPAILDIRENEDFLMYVFKIPPGMNPNDIEKKDYVFTQLFGANIEITGDSSLFTLKVYKTSMPKELIYNFNEIQPLLKPFKLGIVSGKDRNGQYVLFDLLKQPHILIAGETGSGKSTQLRSILTTLILSKRADELHLYLGDCKKSEFHIFRKVEHVQCVLSTSKDIRKMLKHIKKELDERSDLTEVFEVSHVDDLPVEHKRPYIVVCIDEFVMLRKDEEIMEILTELVAIGRTLGVFAILSMQRPNAKVLDTTIRANLTVSMGFKLRDITESRIVNTPKAHEIDVSGRFIMNSDKLYELQAPYLKIEDAKKLLNPFMVSKVEEVHEETEPKEEQPKLTKSDIFGRLE
ncbi:FtsK/SpoIIIE domain-containing protein [Metabacillus halosaccharovorans]|uniref:FtsK/SpoIIIE domain-containing protein n=1 Tax=Metabacillus halosaccharovorans TaxID=930124 RepID=UPI00204077ED|nr:FtsK/SpoIIIE domain-containing protein [Metabacillus halosaccharovorans]MCM3444399.1 FtsK/SpoIIIE domain-containing protein [Metabacillus halosaccharovorans]